MKQSVIPSDIIESVVGSMSVPNISNIYFEYGTHSQIMESLIMKDNSISQRGKYPMIALVFPIHETRGQSFYNVLKVSRIVIAALSSGTDTIQKRFATGGVYKSILYPIYYEFLNKLASSKYTNISDPDSIKHTKVDYPSRQPLGQGSTDFVDIIEIQDLEIILNQIKTCN